MSRDRATSGCSAGTGCSAATAPSPDDVSTVLADVKPHLMVTDPPYGVDYDPAWRQARRRQPQQAASSARSPTTTGPTGGRPGRCFRDRSPTSGMPAATPAPCRHSLEAVGFEVRAQIIWAKDRFALSRGHYHWQHEPCWYAVRGTARRIGPATASSRRSGTIPAREDDGLGHGTQKPVECMKRPIENNSSPGQAVYEPFCGSGTTIIAAEMTGRSCHAIELDPAYVDVAVQRWQAFTGENARLGSGSSIVHRSSRRAGRRGRVLMGRRAHKPVARFGRAQRRHPFGLPARGAPCVGG